MSARAREESIKRNAIVKVVITFLLAMGMYCAVFAIRSCRWFAFHHDESSGNPLFQDWSFLAEIESESTITVGMFSYQPFCSDQEFDDDGSSNMTVAALDTAAGNEEEYYLFNEEDCVNYPEFWVGTDYPWKFTSQLFIVLGSIFAFASWSVMIASKDHFWIGSFFLLAAGLQCATVIASLSWCDQYWNCPWLMGALANLMAAVLYTLCWALAVCGLVEVNTNRRASPAARRNKNTEGRGESRKRRENSGRDRKKHEGRSDEEESCPTCVIVKKDEMTGSRSGNSTCFKDDVGSKTSDSERGSNTLPLYRTDQLSQGSDVYIFESSSSEDDSKHSISYKELYDDASFDHEMDSEPISQEKQTIRDCTVALKEYVRSKPEENSSRDSSERSKRSSCDSSSTGKVE